ncbi:hypothetical protein EVC45_07595 [Paraburkholderia sp. UYCP14C]|uniref:YadA-like family protein n=1 Tax=Paraburkholderia sp. UYCP14C TaxID=2511130 RepID=UPI00101F8537|nr:YadA-like family protein [Paraburkholderia sp. UYCP14C]RZF30340.1 hypothetical protein EVC45_07595 [Paraburkholderia sp. UYCP14C]
MNKSYISIWNEALGSWVAASENAVARGKRSKATVFAVVATTALAAASWAPVAHAQYSAGGGVAAGATSIAVGTGAKTTGKNISSIAIGLSASADSGTSATAYSATALGTNSVATGDGAVALGDTARATADKATAVGRGALASGTNSSAFGAGASASAANSMALGAGSIADRANTVSVGSATARRQITNVAAGTQDSDAVVVSQLKGVTAALGGGASVNADGSIKSPIYNVGGTTVDNMGDAVTNIDNRVTDNSKNIAINKSEIANMAGDITNITNNLNDGTIGLVQQDSTSKAITVAKGLDGTTVDFSGTDGVRTLSGVADGAVAAGSKEAVNGSQLYANSESMAAGLGGGSTVNPDGTVSAPSYSVDGTTVHNVGDAVANLDDRVTQNTTDITKLQTQVGDVGTQLSGAVQYDRNADGSVNFGSVTLGGSQSAGQVILTNVANGQSPYDAVNFGQLSALQDQVTDLNGQVKDLGSQMSNIQPGNPILNTPDVSAPDSGNGAVVNAAMPGTGVGSTVVGANANAAADNAVAMGTNAAATGVNSTAIGTGSQAGNANSVALGQGSATDRDNSVSVGSAGNERQITNVAAGTANTDAVNVGQMNSSVAQGVQQANSYTDQRINATNQAINNVAKSAYAGIAAAMAMPNMTPSGPGKTIVAAGGATYKGGSAAAVGATYRSRNNKWLVNAALSVTSTGDAGVRAQVGYEF